MLVLCLPRPAVVGPPGYDDGWFVVVCNTQTCVTICVTCFTRRPICGASQHATLFRLAYDELSDISWVDDCRSQPCQRACGRHLPSVYCTRVVVVVVWMCSSVHTIFTVDDVTCTQVERAKKCLDFAATAYIIHFIIVLVFSGFPSNFEWYVWVDM